MWTGDKPSEHGRWGAATYISKHKDDTLICQWSIAEPSLDFVACYCKLNFNLLFVCLITALLNVQELSISLLAFRLVFPKAGHRAIGRVVSWDHGCKLQDVQTFWFRGQRPWGADQLCRAINRLFACTLLLHDVVTFHIFWTCFLIRGVRRPSWRRFSNVQSFSLDLQYKRQSCQSHRLFQNIPYDSLLDLRSIYYVPLLARDACPSSRSLMKQTVHTAFNTTFPISWRVTVGLREWCCFACRWAGRATPF